MSNNQDLGGSGAACSAERTDTQIVAEYMQSRSGWVPRVLTDANNALDGALEAAVKEFSRLGLTAEQIDAAFAEAIFEAWQYLPGDDPS